jgi:hypothetical protein
MVGWNVHPLHLVAHLVKKISVLSMSHCFYYGFNFCVYTLFLSELYAIVHVCMLGCIHNVAKCMLNPQCIAFNCGIYLLCIYSEF